MADGGSGTDGEGDDAGWGVVGVSLWGHGGAVLQDGHAERERPLGADLLLI